MWHRGTSMPLLLMRGYAPPVDRVEPLHAGGMARLRAQARAPAKVERLPASTGRIEDRTRCLDGGVISIGPSNKGGQRLKDRAAERRQAVFHAGRLGREHRARDQAVALQIAEGLRQHSLGYVRDRASDRAEAAWARCKVSEHQRGPFIADAVENVAHGASFVRSPGLRSSETGVRPVDGCRDGYCCLALSQNPAFFTPPAVLFSYLFSLERQGRPSCLLRQGSSSPVPQASSAAL